MLCMWKLGYKLEALLTVVYVQEKFATIAVSEMRGRILMGKKLQIDFASRECEVAFFDNLTKQGFNLPPEKPWERVSSK